MDAKTLEALKASIAKWERNAEAKMPGEFKTSSGSCPLCALFMPCRCARCPVFEKTRAPYCMRTPYETAYTAKQDWRDDEPGAEARAHAAARDEVAFLKNLLPEETP